MIAPMEENSHPIMLMPPYTAKEAGSKNTPDPIMLPNTREVACSKPIFLLVSFVNSSLFVRDVKKNNLRNLTCSFSF